MFWTLDLSLSCFTFKPSLLAPYHSLISLLLRYATLHWFTCSLQISLLVKIYNIFWSFKFQGNGRPCFASCLSGISGEWPLPFPCNLVSWVQSFISAPHRYCLPNSPVWANKYCMCWTVLLYSSLIFVLKKLFLINVRIFSCHFWLVINLAGV